MNTKNVKTKIKGTKTKWGINGDLCINYASLFDARVGICIYIDVE